MTTINMHIGVNVYLTYTNMYTCTCQAGLGYSEYSESWTTRRLKHMHSASVNTHLFSCSAFELEISSNLPTDRSGA